MYNESEAYWKEINMDCQPASMYFSDIYGVFRQIPAKHRSETDSWDYDPRRRPWFVAAMSGPKDVILVLDRTQGMAPTSTTGDKFAAAKDAAITVIETLTVSDRVAVVLFDVTQPISEADIRIVDMALESGRALVLAFNKWDELDDERRKYLEREIEQDLAHVDWAPRVNISAKTGRHLEKLVPALEVALDGWDTRVATGKFNAFLQELTMENPHPVRGGKQPRILYGSQVSSRPPKFVLFTTGFLDQGYRRFIQRRLRETYGFEGSPIEVAMRIREKRKR
jgi:predicted GTPase